MPHHAKIIFSIWEESATRPLYAVAESGSAHCCPLTEAVAGIVAVAQVDQLLCCLLRPRIHILS